MFKIIVSIFVVYLIFSFLGDASDNWGDIQKTTVYESTCFDSDGTEDGLSDCKEKGGYIYTSKMEFRIDFKNQLVVKKGESSSRMTDCVVFDKENWNCGFRKGVDSSWLEMKDGRFSASYYIRTEKNGKIVVNANTSLAIFYWLENIKRLFGAR